MPMDYATTLKVIAIFTAMVGYFGWVMMWGAVYLRESRGWFHSLPFTLLMVMTPPMLLISWLIVWIIESN
jgi:membrane-bound metal-dependent hydrolase YbcI (DUF457 family)